MMFKLLQNHVCNKPKQLPSVFTLSVRWATKPRWLPIAKTKAFRIPVRHNQASEERAELKRLNDNYRTTLRAVINNYKMNYQQSATADEVIEKREQDIKDSWDECMRYNDEWNAKIAVEREERNKLALEKEIERAKIFIKQEDAEKKKTQENIDKLLREQQELSKTFITEKNIDAHIQKILSEEPFTFEWAIDTSGQVYEGCNMHPNPDKSLSTHGRLTEVMTEVTETYSKETNVNS